MGGGERGKRNERKKENRKRIDVCGLVGLVWELYFADVLLGFETEAVPGSCYCNGD